MNNKENIVAIMGTTSLSEISYDDGADFGMVAFPFSVGFFIMDLFVKSPQ